MEIATLVWSFKVQREHHNQLLTCQANHKAFENSTIWANHWPRPGHLRPLRRSIRLEVLYEPVIELTKDTLHLFEFKPVRFSCLAHGRPNELTYRWLIDDQPVTNASQPELYIPSLTRQLHLREIKCEVSNQVGVSTAIIRLAIKYSPAYVTHRLPASLRPDPSHSASPMAPESARPARPRGAAPPLDRRLSQQLALSAQAGHDVTLRCDFDSNPRPERIRWFKLSSDYSVMSDVTPPEADELMATGAVHAHFRRSDAAGPQSESVWHEHSKRHISSDWSQLAGGHLSPAGSSFQPHGDDEDGGEGEELGAFGRELDYEQMSAETLEELAHFEALQQKQQQQANGSLSELAAQSPGGQVVVSIPSDQPSATQSRILEPLGWSLRRISTRAKKLPVSANSNNNHDGDDYHLLPGGQPPDQLDELLLSSSRQVIQQQNQKGRSPQLAALRLSQRQAQLTSSQITLRSVNEDSVGKYICKAIARDGFKSLARAVFLVLHQQPRIISIGQQWAPLGSRQVQVECLAQVNGVSDNQTTISWSKDGKVSVRTEPPVRQPPKQRPGR